MPNWAIGPVEITGTREGVMSFTDRFTTADKQQPQTNKKRLFRSFSDITAAEMNRRIAECFDGHTAGTVRTFSFIASFAWELESNLMFKPPQSREKEFTTVGEACKEDCVQVEIHTSEPSNDLEEWIICREDGVPLYGYRNLTAYRCKYCGNLQSLASFEDAGETECSDCGEIGFEPHQPEKEDDGNGA